VDSSNGGESIRESHLIRSRFGRGAPETAPVRPKASYHTGTSSKVVADLAVDIDELGGDQRVSAFFIDERNRGAI